MTLAQSLSTYLNLNLLLIVGFLGLRLFSLTLSRRGLRLQAGVELRLHYTVFLVILGLTAIHPMLPRNQVFSPAAKVWAAQSIKSFAQDYTMPDQGGYLSLPTPRGTSTVQADRIATLGLTLGIILFILGAFFISRDLHTLFKTKRRSFLVRKIGRVRILVNDQIHVPFSYWLPGQANIVVPTVLIARTTDYQMAIAHELQHHRHGDTRWVYAIWGLKWICILNPAVHFWNRWISELQEFACDETLVDQNKVESQAYARCLVEVAQTAIDQKHVPACATGLMFLVERNLLHRRIERMFSNSTNKMGRSISVAVGAFITLILGATAFASSGLVQDRRVTIDQAHAMAKKAESETGFPVVVNDRVLKQLNRYIGTVEGRDFIRESIARMENHRAIVNDALKKYDMPVEIMAIPIIESGYQNLTERSGSSVRSAGIWQFIRQTARNYGLKVDDQHDERLNVALNTDAAMRYLQSNHLRFRDWQLAILAYNMGEAAVQKAMNTLRTRDAWKLIRNGYEGDKDYLAKVMAAILIMRNPESMN